MDNDKWTSEAVRDAILKNSRHLEMVVANYFWTFLKRLGEYDINVQGVASVEELHQKVLDGIGKLEILRKDFISVVEMFAASRNPLLNKYLPEFFGKLLNYYEEAGISLYAGKDADLLRNDHYRFFNKHLFISLTAILVEHECFDTLHALSSAKFRVYYKSSGIVREVNFMRFREYNYTLNEFMNVNSPRRISVTADYIMNYTDRQDRSKLVRADILLYYVSLWSHSGDSLDSYWHPELSVYNREIGILPHMVSMSYFENAKVLFNVDTVAQYKQLLDTTPDPLDRGGVYKVPGLKQGLLYETVGSME